MPNEVLENEQSMTLRELLCSALHVIERSRQILEGVTTAKRADIVRNMSAIEMQVSACQDLVDRLNIAVGQVEGDSVIALKHKLPEVIVELMNRSRASNAGVVVDLVLSEESATGIAYKVDGFYKSGNVILAPRADGSLIATSRYNEKDDIDDFRDLVRLNKSWWERSKERADGWGQPADGWADWMVEFGLITRNVRTVVEYK